MGGGAQTSGRFPNNYDKNIKDIFFDEYSFYTPEYSELFNVSSHDEQFLKESDMATLGTMEKVAEGQGGQLDSFTEGNNKTVYFSEFKKNTQLTEVAKEDDLFNLLMKQSKELGKSASQTVEYLAWDLINNGTGTDTLGLDGKALFASDHPYIDYGANTASNVATNSFSYSSIQTAAEHFEGLKNERGLPINMWPNKIVIPKELKWIAEEILGPGSQYKPGTADNDINSIKSLYDLKYMVGHYLTSATRWFMFAPEQDLRWIWRRNVDMQSWDDKDTGNEIYQAKFRATSTFFRWRGSYSSAPA